MISSGRRIGLDRATFDQLALEHLDAVHRMALQLARSPQDAADLLQETYLKAVRSAALFEERGGGMRPWLFTILHNVFYSERRRGKHIVSAHGEFSDDAAEAPGPMDPPPAWDLASLQWEHVDERIRAGIDGLRPEYRSILLLWGVEGMRYRDIAEIQGIPIGTVMSRLHRARSILAQQLTELAEENRLIRRSHGEGMNRIVSEK